MTAIATEMLVNTALQTNAAVWPIRTRPIRRRPIRRVPLRRRRTIYDHDHDENDGGNGDDEQRDQATNAPMVYLRTLRVKTSKRRLRVGRRRCSSMRTRASGCHAENYRDHELCVELRELVAADRCSTKNGAGHVDVGGRRREHLSGGEYGGHGRPGE